MMNENSPIGSTERPVRKASRKGVPIKVRPVVQASVRTAR
jgi:hypothetical protein